MIKTSTRDREALMKFLEQETGAPSQYLGAPTFAYQIGAYKLLRNADIDCISPPDESFLQHLRESGFLENSITAEGISIPFTTTDPRSRMNLICMLSMRAKLINKAIGQDNAFIIRKGFLQKLKDHNPATLDEFRAEMAHLDAGRNLRGVHILDDRVIFTGFPDTASDAEQQAFRDLATCMVRSSEAQRWVKAASDDIVNEKYAFRVFLVKIGMKGKEYDMTRAILIERLSGDSTYRLPEQKLQFEEKRRIERRRAYERKHENDFIVL